MDNNVLILAADHGPLLGVLLTQQSLVIMITTFGGMLAFMVAEQLFPNVETDSVPVSRWLTNWLLAFVNFVGALLLMSYLGTAAWMPSLSPAFQMTDYLPSILVVAMLVISIEFISYWIHRLFHKNPFMWRVHAVHHMETEIDVTTSHRHHFLEVFSSTIVLTLLVLALGLPMVVAFTYQLLRILLIHFNHSNLRIPALADQLLRPFIVTPSFHRVHHSVEPTFSNSNYGTVVPWFDYLFRTAHKPGAAAGLPLGLGYLSGKKDGRLHRVLLLPFMWRRWKITDE